ncbi:MAG: molybdopterin-binding protein [Acidobacteriota bacterium]
MEFAPVPLDEAEGKILGHNVIDGSGRRLLRKGRALSAEDVELLRGLGRSTVWTAALAEGDVEENEAALRSTESAVAGAVRLAGPSTGRVNIHATELGVVEVAPDGLLAFNECSGFTLATLRSGSVVRPDRMVATTKILPYAVSRDSLQQALDTSQRFGPLVRVRALPRRAVGLVVTASAATVGKVTAGFEKALGLRLEGLGSGLRWIDRVVHDDAASEPTEERIARAILEQIDAGADLVLLAGETAIQDESDQAPRAVELAGGEVITFGAPVDPGNLLMLGDVRGTAIVGAPGCARSPKRNIVDIVLPQLLLGERLNAVEIQRLGHGGLLEDVPERPLPRHRIDED